MPLSRQRDDVLSVSRSEVAGHHNECTAGYGSEVSHEALGTQTHDLSDWINKAGVVNGALDANPALKADTAVFITWDEAGGYYDSGFIQPIDFFGDGPRIPLLVLSPYSTGGKIHHAYGDHASLLKFIERNWDIAPLTNRSRDNLPNPESHRSNPYVPTNMPALDDLFDAFDFSKAVNQPYTE